MLNCPYCDHELSPHEIGLLYNTFKGRRKGKLNAKAAEEIRNSNIPLKELARKYQVTFATVWRVREKITWATKLSCPHCKHDITEKQINKLFATLGGLQGRTFRKLTVKAVQEIRSSKQTYSELAKKYKVSNVTIWKVKAYRTWKEIS